MSVDFPSTPSPPISSAPRPADVQTLHDTFVAVLRSFGTEKGGLPTNTLLEVLRPNPSEDAGIDRHQQRRETQQRADKNDFTQLDRQQLNRSELRDTEMDADYRNRQDRHAMLRNDYRQFSARHHAGQGGVHQSGGPAVASLLDVVIPSEPMLDANLPTGNPQSMPVQQNNVPQVSGSPISASIAASPIAASPSSATPVVQSAVQMLGHINTSTAVQPSVPQTLTIFTPTGRLVQQEKPEDEDDEKEEREQAGEQSETKPAKKKQPFAVLESIRAETTRPLLRHELSGREQFAAPPAMKPAPQPEYGHHARNRVGSVESVDDSHTATHSVRSLEELLNASPHNVAEHNVAEQSVAVPKKGESQFPNQVQYLNRIAAACEAAAHYAPIRIKIHLDHLGTLTLRFYHKADRLALRFETPSRQSAQFLRNHFGELADILSRRNVRTMDIEMQWHDKALAENAPILPPQSNTMPPS